MSQQRFLTFRRILLIIWKNILLRRRHKAITIMQFILPLIFGAILVFLTFQYPEDTRNISLRPPRPPDEDIAGTETNLMAATIFVLSDNLTSNITIAYAPRTEFAKDIMTTFYKTLRFVLDSQFPNLRLNLVHFENEAELEANFSKTLLTQDPKQWKVAIIFDEDASIPGQKISYKIRVAEKTELPGANGRLEPIPPRRLLKAKRSSMPTLIPVPPIAEMALPYSDFLNQGGITGLQIMLERAMLFKLTNNTRKYSITLNPIPSSEQNLGSGIQSRFIQLYFVFINDVIIIGVIFIVPAVMSPIVAEKETGIKELMKMMGLPNWMHWLGWMLDSMMVLTLSMTALVILFIIPFSSNGEILRYDDPFVFWVLLILYSMASTAFCFFVSVFFHKPVLASGAGIVIWLVSYYALAVPFDIMQGVMFSEKMATALLPNMALHWAITVMSDREPNTGTTWKNIGDVVRENDDTTVLHMFLMLVIDTILYLLLAVYLENVLPSEFGVRKPWYYIFLLKNWTSPRKVSPTGARDPLPYTSTDDLPGFEEELTNLVPGIVFHHLTKTFGKNKVAVDRLSFKIYTGQITALLGHNGAGKTTTISILTGIFAPTSGTAVINGFDINTQMNEIRSDLGLCPQHNMLFDELTVEDHLIFFGRLKGLTTKQASQEMISLLSALNLSEKRKAFSKSLSGGQKRKLSLMIALIGGTKVVILDEPTSGMDPEARRGIWDLLLALRGQRTIILTTHFMEEADVLGDRIAIMAGGKIKCCGTPIFLKKFYGTGYSLKLTTNSDTSSKESIIETVRKYIEEAEWKSQQFEHATDLTITLPNEAGSISQFSPMFSDISLNKENLGIATIGLQLTTMDEVFSKVDELNREEIERNKPKEITNPNQARRASIPMPKTMLSKFSLFVVQFWALTLKRFLYTIQKRKLLIGQIALPIVILIGTILIVNSALPSVRPSFNEYKINQANHENSEILFTSTNQTFGDAFTRRVSKSRQVEDAGVSDELQTIGRTMNERSFQERHIFAADFNDDKLTLYYAEMIHDSIPFAVNLISNTILEHHAPGMNYSIELSFHPLDNLLERAKPIMIYVENARQFPVIYPLFGIFVPASLSIVAASFTVFPIEENISKIKQLQLMTGVSPLIYWGSIYVWDFLLLGLISALMTACFGIFQDYYIFTSYGGGAFIFFLLLLYGFDAIPFSYLCSLTSKSVPGGFAVVTVLHILTGSILPMATQILLFYNETRSLSRVVRHIGRPFPTYGISLSLMDYASTAVQNTRCNLLPEKVKETICSEVANPFHFFDLQRKCCENCRETAFSPESCFKREDYLIWTHEYQMEDVPDLGQELTVIFVMGCFYTLLFLLVEYGVFRKLKLLIFGSPKVTFHSYSNDEDVQEEIQRVKTLAQAGDTENDALIVDGLCKSYGSFAAVSNLSFGVHFGECFGLLGVNGAGKTTTFRMLTGDETRSNGNAFIFKYNLNTDREKFLALVGYCPQFDAIIGVLSGRQMLALFARLRGVPRSMINSEVDKWLEKLGLTDAGNVQCQKYSGGMKRRLSAGMAMIGDPPIVLLDEPTSGVDPVARRQFWQVIAKLRDSGRSIILTSHSMDECEALCSRLGIMVNGQFQCFGGVQHLKNKFAQGFSLILKLKSNIHATSEVAKPLTFRINQLFEPCLLKDQHQNILHYQLLNTAMEWSTLFESLENLKKEFEDLIEDFSVNETTLEDVFLSFAKQQHTHRKTKENRIGIVKKYFSCKC